MKGIESKLKIPNVNFIMLTLKPEILFDRMEWNSVSENVIFDCIIPSGVFNSQTFFENGFSIHFPLLWLFFISLELQKFE